MGSKGLRFALGAKITERLAWIERQEAKTQKEQKA
jgi:hypothetical protein